MFCNDGRHPVVEDEEGRRFTLFGYYHLSDFLSGRYKSPAVVSRGGSISW